VLQDNHALENNEMLEVICPQPIYG